MRCPYCAEKIEDDAVKCHYCGEWLPGVSGPGVGDVAPEKIDPGEAVGEPSKCPACGAPSGRDDAFCTSCGATLQASAALEEPLPADIEPLDPSAAPPTGAAGPRVRRLWYRRRWVIAGAAALAAAVVIVIVVVALSVAHYAPGPSGQGGIAPRPAAERTKDPNCEIVVEVALSQMADGINTPQSITDQLDIDEAARADVRVIMDVWYEGFADEALTYGTEAAWQDWQPVVVQECGAE